MTRPEPQWGGDRQRDGGLGEVATGNRAVVTFRWFLLAVAVLAALVLVMGTVRALLAEDPDPRPGVSPECTEADLDDGACLTWDDIRDQPVYSQEPDPETSP